MELQTIQTKIYYIRDCKVMLDFDLAELYEVETRALKQAVKRNLDLFPDDFMFQLTKIEWQELITNCDKLPETIKFSPIRPLAFTEQGVAMLSSVLKSKKARQINISIMPNAPENPNTWAFRQGMNGATCFSDLQCIF